MNISNLIKIILLLKVLKYSIRLILFAKNLFFFGTKVIFLVVKSVSELQSSQFSLKSDRNPRIISFVWIRDVSYRLYFQMNAIHPPLFPYLPITKLKMVWRILIECCLKTSSKRFSNLVSCNRIVALQRNSFARPLTLVQPFVY